VTFRVKLLLILGTATLTCVAMIVASTAVNVGQSRVLDDVERRLLPKLEVGPRIVAQFEALRRGMQDAVAAQDADSLIATKRTKDELLALLAPGSALTPEDRAALVAGVNEYYEQASRVSHRMLAGDTGETLEAELATMQSRHHALSELIERATRLKPNELEASFASVRRASRRADNIRAGLGVSGLLALLALSVWVRRGVLRPLGGLSSGFARFAEGDFGKAIPLTADDELNAVAKEANQMAAKLQRLNKERDKREWLQSGLAELSERLRGDHSPNQVSELALAYLANRVDALAGALYVADDRGVLHLHSHYAYRTHDDEAATGAALPSTFRPGEGLVGQAFQDDRVRVVEDTPPDYLKVRSALGEAAPTTLLLLPITHGGRRMGVLELALFTSGKEEALELLETSRESVVITMEAAKSRATLQELLKQSREQAERLQLQEEELRVTNQDLQAQQEELRQANEELEAQRGALDRQNVALETARTRVLRQVEELAQVSSYKSQFLANMSHELRTPLNSMLLLSHLLAENEERNLTARQVEHCRTIHGAGQDLLALINQILDLAKIEAGKQEVRLELVPVSGFCEHARRVFEPMVKQKGLALLIKTAPELPEHFVTDRYRVERILTNLIGNALKFTESGHILLEIGRPAAGQSFENSQFDGAPVIALSVSDTGIGIAPESLDRVFMPFEQVTSTERNYGGSGLGLAIARESARLLGGELIATSEVGRGSTFTLYLPEKPPIAENHSRAPVRRDEAREQRRTHGTSDKPRNGGRLLIIEDDELLSDQLAELIRDRGLGVMVARTGTEGLSLARSGQPQGIVLDVKLPDITGWEVIQRLRDDPATRGIPVHFLSASDDEQRGLSLGAIGYLTKPATRSDLASVVQTLAPSARNSRRVLVVEDSVAEGLSVQQLLESEGIESRHVASATGAFGALTNETFGCIILDLGLPDMDGLGLLKAIRERPDLPRPRVVVHTGRALTKEEIRELEQYAEAVVLKDGNSAERLMEEIRLFVHHIQGEREAPAPAKVGPKSDVLKGAKLLLADDDMRTVYALSAFLRSKGAEVIVADTGKEAIEQMQRHPDTRVVLMDMMMPEMDGYEAIRRLRARPEFSKVPIIALTAKAMKGERETCMAAGATDYLPKPVDTNKLLQALGAHLGA
jgi:CheY-like chemotaxis protein/signal transduction histidine kinase/HAMP domain-containing protein